MSGFKPQQILCLVDLSPASRLVLCWARLFAQAFASRIEVLHASERRHSFLIEGQEQAQLELTKTELHGAVGSLAQEILGNRMPYHIVVEEGHPVLWAFQMGIDGPLSCRGYDSQHTLAVTTVTRECGQRMSLPVLCQVCEIAEQPGEGQASVEYVRR